MTILEYIEGNYYDSEQAAEILGIHVESFRRLVRHGELEVERPFNMVMFVRKDYLHEFKTHYHPHPGGAPPVVYYRVLHADILERLRREPATCKALSLEFDMMYQTMYCRLASMIRNGYAERSKDKWGVWVYKAKGD